MGQKVNPTSMRLQILKNWQSKWYAPNSSYRHFLAEDLQIRRLIENKLGKRVGIDKVEIERSPNQVSVIIYSARPGMIIGRGGAGIEALKKDLAAMMASPLKLTIEEVKRPELKAQLVADNIAGQIERRMNYRRAIHTALDGAQQAGAKGVKVVISGRLGGYEMARTAKEIVGSMPLHTLRAEIEYGQSVAQTSAGLIGVKVWINRSQEN